MKNVSSQTVSKSSLPSGGLLLGAFEAVVAPVDAAVTRVLDRFLTWNGRMRDRRSLGRLDAHMLHDIGLSPADVEHEVSKPFWQD